MNEDGFAKIERIVIRSGTLILLVIAVAKLIALELQH